MWGAQLNRDNGLSFCDVMGGKSGKPLKAGKEFRAWCFGARRHTLPALLLALLEQLKDPREKEHLEMLNCLRTKMSTLLGKDGVLLLPVYTKPAPYHNEPIVIPFDIPYTAIVNGLGFPSCAVPLGLSKKEGVPIGIQIIAGMYQDRLPIAVAEELERGNIAKWVSPSNVDLQF